MDYFKGMFACSKCGQGPGSIPITKLIVSKPISLLSSNYCPKCGAAIRKTCSACNGTGRGTYLLSLGRSRDSYCSECGRKLPEPDATCSLCNGTGEVFDSNHCLYCASRSGF